MDEFGVWLSSTNYETVKLSLGWSAHWRLSLSICSRTPGHMSFNFDLCLQTYRTIWNVWNQFGMENVRQNGSIWKCIVCMLGSCLSLSRSLIRISGKMGKKIYTHTFALHFSFLLFISTIHLSELICTKLSKAKQSIDVSIFKNVNKFWFSCDI